MKNNFCTLFDSHYLTRGLALYHSLVKNCKDFNLYIFAFDDESYHLLETLDLKKTEIIHHSKLMNAKILEAVADRTKAEYCWTCTPLTIQYCLDNFNLSSCTYLDADTFFFDSPEIILNEILPTKNSVLITEHYFPEQFQDWIKTSGKYNVQFMTFKNDVNGRKCLDWWAERCIEWCYARTEDGKMGDQLYLQDWTTRFEGIHVMNNRGGGLAPWNLLNFKFKKNRESSIELFDCNTKKIHSLVFYHFHALKFFRDAIQLSGPIYPINNFTLKNIYEEYLETLEDVCEKYKLKNTHFNHWNKELEHEFYIDSKPIHALLYKGRNFLLKTLNFPIKSQHNKNIIMYPERRFKCQA